MANKMTIAIIGAGNMGSAIIASIHKNYRVLVCDKDAKRAQILSKKFGLKTVDLQNVAKDCNIILLAVKPQNFEDVLRAIKLQVNKSHLIVSIAAGITSKYIEKMLGNQVRVVRTMPNLPAQIGQGITGISSGKYAQATDLTLARRILSAVGKVVIVDEKQLDALTAVSGSGPAYLFYFTECFEAAAKKAGITDPTIRRQLVNETLKGSLALMLESGEDAVELRKRVTSKGGSTQAALEVMMKNNFEKIMIDALKAAKNRSKELSR